MDHILCIYICSLSLSLCLSLSSYLSLYATVVLTLTMTQTIHYMGSSVWARHNQPICICHGCQFS